MSEDSTNTQPVMEGAVLHDSVSTSVKTLNLFNAHHSSSEREKEGSVTPLGFVATHRVVAVLEKAVERLELLSLLDTTAPEDVLAAAPLSPKAGSVAVSTGTSPRESKSLTYTPRKAALLTGRPNEMSRKTLREVNTALQMAAERQRGGRATVADLVIEQQRLERRYGELLRQARKVNPNPNDPTLDPECFANAPDVDRAAIMEELKQTSRSLREHNKVLFIRLKDNPNDSDNWRKIGSERTDLIRLLQDLVREITTGCVLTRPTAPSAGGTTGVLSAKRSFSESIGTESRDTSMLPARSRFGSTSNMKRVLRGPAAPRIPLTSRFERFAKLIADEQSAQRWADELVAKEKELNQNVKQLLHELKAEKIQKEKDVDECRQRLAALKARLREEKNQAKEKNEMVRIGVEAGHEATQRMADDEKRIIAEAIHNTEQEEMMEDRAHLIFKRHLIERTEAMDELAMQWDRKNQKEIKIVEARKIDMEQMRQMCAERLQKAEEDKADELQLKAERNKERQEEERIKMNLEMQANRKYEAVSKIQSAIRAMLSRQALIVLKKKSKRKRKAEQM